MHITTRQDIQLHGVSPLESVKVIRECTANGLPFRGGGGDTFRNIAKITESRVVLTDVDGNRYEIDDVLALDGKSYRKIELYL